jgi:4-alpha-glucanotransferase
MQRREKSGRHFACKARVMSDRAPRRAGVLVPLFSAPSTASWGVGDIGDIPRLTAWLARGGMRVLQLLPLNEMAPGQHSPYSAISAMAIDPLFIAVPAVPDFNAIGGDAWLTPDDRRTLAEVRESTRVRYADVRRLKQRALEAAFARFFEVEWCHNTERAGDLKAFVEEQAWWLDDYALFRAVHVREKERPWTEWPEALRHREPQAIQRARHELFRDVLYQQYMQWTAGTQWRDARTQTHGVEIFGDLPFMVDGDSADVWARQHQFRLDVSIGVPPDAFSETGQDWGMPLSRWDVMAAEGFNWLRDRARRSADLYQGYRVDHLVGFYRTYARPRSNGVAFFTPAVQAEQQALGESVLEVLRAAGSEIVAEDLGDVPDFVRESLAQLGIPGFRVFQWERKWHTDGAPFRDPADYPAASVATSGTHDTEPLVVWWRQTLEDDRKKVDEIPTIHRLTDGTGIVDANERRVRDVLLEALFASGSDLVMLPVTDVFGWSDRINKPATVTDANWTFRLPWLSDRLNEAAEARERQSQLRKWAEEHHRM